MIQKEEYVKITNSLKKEWPKITEKDISFVILCDTIADKGLAYKLAYDKDIESAKAKDYYNTKQITAILNALAPYGIGVVNEDTITKEQNKAELIQLLDKIKNLADNKMIALKDAVKMEADIRVKLNDKFEMDLSNKQKRIIVVPQKHDIVCPKTNMECNYWPSKTACMKHYNLKD